MKFDVAATTTLYLLSSIPKILGAVVDRIVVGPTYTTSDPAWFSPASENCADCNKGIRIDLFMPIGDTTYNCDPNDWPNLLNRPSDWNESDKYPLCVPNCGQREGEGTPGTRNMTVYIPADFDDSKPAPLHIELEGSDYFFKYDKFKQIPGMNFTTPDGRTMELQYLFPNLMDTLIGSDDEDRSLPSFVYVALGLAGPGQTDAFFGSPNCGDGCHTARATELITVSGEYAQFIAYEVLPYIENHPEIKARYPNFRFSEDPRARVIQGQSNGGAAAFKAAFFRPDLFGNAIGYSPAIDQQGCKNLTSDDEYPLNNADFWVPPPKGKGVIAATPLTNHKARFWLNANQNDTGTEHGCILGQPAPHPGGQYGNFLVAANETAIALANRGNEVVFVYGQNACHTDQKIYQMEGANAVIWAWSEWKKIVSMNETTPTSTTAPTSTDSSAAVRTFNGIWFIVGIIVATARLIH